MSTSLRWGVSVAAAAGTAAAAALWYARRRPAPGTWYSTHRLSNGRAVQVRSASRDDVPAIYDLIYALAVVCGEGHEMMVDVRGIVRAFDDGDFEALVALIDGEIVGMAIVQQSFRTFTGMSLYLQDLIVAQAYRSMGLGSLLFRICAAAALRRGCNRLFWESVADNHSANKFYSEGMGAERVDCHLNWRLEGLDALAACAQKAV